MGALYGFELAGQHYSLAIANQHYYVLGDDTLLPVRVEPAWCERCCTFVIAERISSILVEAKELSELEYFSERPGLIPPNRRMPLWQVPELRLRKTWRTARRSPAKCLTCGSVEITSIPLPGPDVNIPGRGKCKPEFYGFRDFTRGPATGYYSPEGDRVPFGAVRRRGLAT